MDNVTGMERSKDRIVAMRDEFLRGVEHEMQTAAEFGATWNFGNFGTEDRARRAVFGDLSAAVFGAIEDVTDGIDQSISEDVGETEDPTREHGTHNATSIYGSAA